MAALMRAKDWSANPVGPVESWPQSLRSVVQIMLGSRFAMWMSWGRKRTFFYNDAYRPTLGGKHPWALGSPASEVWAEIWPAIGPRIEIVEQRGEATWDEGLLLFLERHGYPEETYHTFSYSPLPDDEGGIGGMLCVVTEETERIIGERRLRILREVATRIATTRTPAEVFKAIEARLAAERHDLPFALIYLQDGDGERLRLVASSGLAAGHRVAPTVIGEAEGGAAWPIADLLARSAPVTIGELAIARDELPAGPWNEPPRQAIALPIAQQGQSRPAGVFITGLNPYRPFDEAYRGFLGLLVGQIAAGLANARAYEAERRRAEALAELDRAKTAFFSNASHEFRTPLTLMLGPLEDLLVGAASSEIVLAQRREIELMHRNGLRLLKLVNTLLDFSRIEAGRVQSSFEPVDLATYTGELASTFRSAMDKAGLRYRVDCPTSPVTAYVDRDMWEKIVLNLVSNAFKYTFHGEVAVSLTPTPDRSAVELTVRDTGEGIPPHEVPRLFERFHRVEGQRGRTQEGSGIGLALVQELVKIHGGTVRAESELNRGTTIRVAMPLGRTHLPAERISAVRGAPTGSLGEAFVEEALRWLPDEPDGGRVAVAAQSIGPEPARPAPGRRFRVLLADDNADMRDYARRLLAERYEVEAVADGQAALDAARRQRPDLVLSDVMMPRLDGFGLLQALRGDPDLRDVPVVLLSARAGEEAKIEGIEIGADDYLVKPFSARELIARVAANLDMARMRRESAEALRDEARALETLNRTGVALAAELDLERLVQTATDAGVELTGARFGTFFYNTTDEAGEAYMLYALSGVSRDAFAGFPMPRNTAIFEPTFSGTGIVRSSDIRTDPRYGKSTPHHGMPIGHLPVRSYLAVPVTTRSGEVLGGLFFGHPEPGVFGERAERLARGIAAQAAVAIDNARLYRASQREIEARKRIEADLQHFNQTLEQRVSSEITARMRVEEALRQAQKMEAVGQLTGGIAHDFNNLLTVIQGNLETIERRFGDASPQLRRAVEAGLRGTERAATLTHRLLAFSRRQPLDPKPIDLNKLVAGMSDLLRRTLGEAVTIRNVLASDLWRTAADTNQLESALLNLAVNARDAMTEGGQLTIETANTVLDESYAARHEEVMAGEYVMLAVSDTGTGMPQSVIDRAFEPFFTTKQIGQGTGLGLSQVYGFVKQSGGHVKIDSAHGQGTTIRLYLPRLAGGIGGETDTISRPPLPSTGKGETVLVVEDDDDVRAHSAGILRELGYRVLEAPDGATALRLLAERREIDLLFTDVGLGGGLDGRQLGDEARQRHAALKVLFTSGYARDAIVHQGRLDPGVALIVKPFTYAALAKRIPPGHRRRELGRGLIGRRRAAAVGGPPTTPLRTFGQDAPSAAEAIGQPAPDRDQLSRSARPAKSLIGFARYSRKLREPVRIIVSTGMPGCRVTLFGNCAVEPTTMRTV
jgi:signal transduction histidine kinase/DNA-binding response OmpR family regulator